MAALDRFEAKLDKCVELITELRVDSNTYATKDEVKADLATINGKVTTIEVDVASVKTGASVRGGIWGALAGFGSKLLGG